MNTALLVRVKEAILAEPGKFDMDSFFHISVRDYTLSDIEKEYGEDVDNEDALRVLNRDLKPEMPNDLLDCNVLNVCGTTGCIAGWALHLTDAKILETSTFLGVNFEDAAIKELGITKTQARSLFYDHRWPEKFDHDYNNSDSFYDRARIAAERIQFFIDTNGTDEVTDAVQETTKDS